MGKYAIVRTDNMSGTIVDKDLFSLRADKDIENGTIVKVGAYEENQREVRACSTPAVGDELINLALIATPELVKDKKNFALSDFVNPKGSIMRGYRLVPGDLFGVSKAAFASEDNLKNGSTVELDGAGKLKAVTAATGGSTEIGKIALVEDDLYVIEVSAPKAAKAE